jgi:enoyl-CoA hydratase/carnithine racemase
MSSPLTMASITFDTIKVSRPSPTIALVTLSRPDQRNSFNQLMTDEFEKVFKILDQDETVRAVVLTGEGKTFCAGADLNSGILERIEGDGPKDHRDQ